MDSGHQQAEEARERKKQPHLIVALTHHGQTNPVGGRFHLTLTKKNSPAPQQRVRCSLSSALASRSYPFPRGSARSGGVGATKSNLVERRGQAWRTRGGSPSARATTTGPGVGAWAWRWGMWAAEKTRAQAACCRDEAQLALSDHCGRSPSRRTRQLHEIRFARADRDDPVSVCPPVLYGKKNGVTVTGSWIR